MFLPYAPFGKDYMMYRFQNRCLELPDLDYPDRLMYIPVFDTLKKNKQP